MANLVIQEFDFEWNYLKTTRIAKFVIFSLIERCDQTPPEIVEFSCAGTGEIVRDT